MRERPVSSRSGGGDELQPEDRDELRPEAATDSKSSGGEVRKNTDCNLESSL